MASDPSRLIAYMFGQGDVGANIQRNREIGAHEAEANQQAMLNQVRIADQVRKWQHDDGWTADAAAYGQNPTIDTLATLATKYPERADMLRSLWKLKSDAQTTNHLTQLGEIYSLADGNMGDRLKTKVQTLRDASAKSGGDTSDFDDMLDLLKSDDPTSIRSVKGMALAHLAASGKGEFAEQFNKAMDRSNPYTLAPGDVRYDANNQIVARGGPKAPEPFHYALKDADGVEHEFVDYGQAGGGAAAPPSGSFDAKRFFHDFVLPHEGGYAAHDANGAPVNMGINQSANPDVDVRNLTKDQAADIFANKYAAKAANLPAPLAAAYADTAYINPSRADQFLQASDGDVGKFLSMRRSWQNSLVASQPDKYGPYAKAWATRNADLANYVQGAPSGGSAGTPTGSRQLDGTPFASTPTATGDPSLTGDAYLASLPVAMRAKVVAVAEGRAAAPRPGTRYGESLLTAVTQYDPTFDAANATSRSKTRVDFTSGKSAMAVNALNTAMGHLFHLDDQATDLHNGDVPLFNSAQRNLRTNLFGQKEYTTFEQTKQAAASEMRKVFAGSAGGNLAELKEWQDSFNSANSPAQLHGAVQNGIELMSSRLSALQDQYATGMGRSDKTPTFIKPSIARQAKARFGVDLGGGAAAPANVPKLGAVQKGYRYRGGNPADPSSWSKVTG